MDKIFRHLKQQPWLWLSLLCFAILIVYVNPLRQITNSDDWAYGRTVETLVNTGTYRLSNWLSANMLFQAYWGALFSLIGGYSFGTLHLSTLVLALVGLIAFYYLAQEHGLSGKVAGLLTLCLLSSPLIMFFSFTFMTDVPFMSLLTIALLCYTRALRLQSYGWMVGGGVAAATACLTRQFGAALVVGLVLLWLLERQRWSKVWFYLTGLSLPAVAIGWQSLVGVLGQNAAARYSSQAQLKYLTNPVQMLGEIVIWRPTVILQYLAFYSLPLVVIAFLAPSLISKNTITNDPITTKNKTRRNKLLVALGVYIGLGILYSRLVKGWGLFMPYLEWNLGILTKNLTITAFITILTFSGGVLYGGIFIDRCRNWRKLAPNLKLLDLVSLCLFGLLMLYLQIGDRYVMVLMPWWLIVAGRQLSFALVKLERVYLAGCLIVAIISAVWVRNTQADEEVKEQVGENLRMSGVDSSQIYASLTWYSYYNFDRYLTQNNNQLDVDEYLVNWLDDKARSGQYLILDPEDLSDVLNKTNRWQIHSTVYYQDGLFRDQQIIVLKKY